jgi:GTP-binding protein HflX
MERDEYGRIIKVRVSAKTGDGLDLVKQAMIEYHQRTTSPLSEPQLHVPELNSGITI